MICAKGRIAAFWLILFLSSCPPFRLVIPAFGQPGIHCVDFGVSTPEYQSIGALRFKPRDLSPMGPFMVLFSPGSTIFQAKEKYPTTWRSKGCPEGFEYNWANIAYFAFMKYCPEDVDIRAYLVRQNGRVLRGWLHFEIELTDRTDEIEWIYVQARDEYFNAIGEFVINEDGDEYCSRPSNKGLISPSKYQVLPCTATGLREAKTSQGVFVAKRSQYEKPVDEQYLPNKRLTRGIHLTWRLNEYWCNRHLRLRLDAHVWTTKNMTTWRKAPVNNIYAFPFPVKYCTKEKNKYCRQRRKVTDYWLHHKWFGAADIKTHGPLDCSTSAIDYTSGVLTREARASWLDSSSRVTFGNDYENSENNVEVPISVYGLMVNASVPKSCQVKAGPNSPSFGGRCEQHLSTEKKTSKNFLQGCITDKNSKEFEAVNKEEFVVYSTYVNEINTKRLRQCDQTCEEPDINNPQDLADIQTFNKTSAKSASRKPPVQFRTLQDARLEVRANTFFQTRKYHGNLCIFIAMFLLPVSNFLIRYYKETFMHDMSLGCAPWFWVHMFVCFAVPTMYRSSWSAMQEVIYNYGTSESAHGTFHRVCGYFFVIVFLLMVVLGGIRPVFRHSRMVCMTMHSVTGFVLYFLAIVLIINSTFIPASPTVHECDPENHLPTGFSFTAKMATAWFVIDLLFHVVLTVFQFAVDKEYQIKRAGFRLLIVPMLPAEALMDLKGSKFRKIALLVYVSLSLVMTFTTIRVTFRDDDQDNCILGNMSCDLSEYLPNKLSSPFGCAPISIQYYAKVYAKYEIKFNETDL